MVTYNLANARLGSLPERKRHLVSKNPSESDETPGAPDAEDL
jgi:hypothetical protein